MVWHGYQDSYGGGYGGAGSSGGTHYTGNILDKFETLFNQGERVARSFGGAAQAVTGAERAGARAVATTKKITQIEGMEERRIDAETGYVRNVAAGVEVGAIRSERVLKREQGIGTSQPTQGTQGQGGSTSVSGGSVSAQTFTRGQVNALINAAVDAQAIKDPDEKSKRMGEVMARVNELAAQNGGMVPMPKGDFTTHQINPQTGELIVLKFPENNTSLPPDVASMQVAIMMQKAGLIPTAGKDNTPPTRVGGNDGPPANPAPGVAPTQEPEIKHVLGKGGTERVAHVQEMLERRGFPTDEGGANDHQVDGVAGRTTNKSVRAAQEVLVKLGKLKEVTGKIDEAFIAALEAAEKVPAIVAALEAASGKKPQQTAAADLRTQGIAPEATAMIQSPAAGVYSAFAGLPVGSGPATPAQDTTAKDYALMREAQKQEGQGQTVNVTLFEPTPGSLPAKLGGQTSGVRLGG